MKLFPNLSDIFHNPPAEYYALFFPLLTIDLTAEKMGEGKIHILTVYGNGNPDHTYESDAAGYNFIRFTRIDNDKYEFRGDISNMPQIVQALRWHNEAKDIYAAHKNDYLTSPTFAEKEDLRRKQIDRDYHDYVKGAINYWITKDQYFQTGRLIRGDYYTQGGHSGAEAKPLIALGKVNENGYDYEHDHVEDVWNELKLNSAHFRFIATLSPLKYSQLGEDEISIFFDSAKNEVFQYFDWS